MTRRHAIRRAVIGAMAMAMGKMDSLKALGGFLICDLDQWAGLEFRQGGRTVTYSPRDIFDAMKEKNS